MNRHELTIPKGARLFPTHSLDGEFKCLNSFEQHPSVTPLFWGFRIMVGVGVLMLVVWWLGVWRTRRAGVPPTWLLRTRVARIWTPPLSQAVFAG